MRLTAQGSRWNGRGNLEATVTLLAEDGTPLFEDLVGLSKQAARHRFAQAVLKRFPGLRGKDLESQLLQLLWQAKDQQQEAEEAARKEAPSRVSQADKLVKLIEKSRVELFHSSTQVAYARMAIENHFEIHRCRSQAFKQWLSRQLYLSEQKTPNSDALNSAIITIEGMAVFDGKTHGLHNRVALHEGAIFYDLSDTGWRAVRITPEGWQIIDNPPILFCRYQHQKPQVEPQHGGDPRQLLNFANLKDSAQQLLFMVYVAAAFIPDIPHPIIHSHGEQGSAKTTQLRLVGSLVDPSSEELLMFARDVNELAQKLYHHWVCYFDNLTSLPDWTSDVLSRAVSGIGFSKRELYTDEGDIIFQLKRVIGLNGINVVATKPDLLDRCILLELKRIPDNERREEKKFLAEFEQVKPQMLGGFFDILSQAMRIYPTQRFEALPRMADFAQWGAAIAQALGYSANEFFNAYNSNIQSQNTEILTSNPVAMTLQAFMENRQDYEGSPAELLGELTREAENLKISTKMKAWPGAPHILTRRLRELTSNLRAGGFLVEFRSSVRDGVRVRRIVRISKEETNSSPRSTESSDYSDYSDYIATKSVDATDESVDATDESVDATDESVDATKVGVDAIEKVASTPLSYGPSYGREFVDAVDATLQPCWQGYDVIFAESEAVILQSLGMSKDKVIAMWDKQGRPVIHLSHGQNCFDLAELLEQRDIELSHLSAVARWLEKHRGCVE